MTINRIDMEEITDRVDELRSERDNYLSDATDGSDMSEEDATVAWNATDEAEELAELEELVEELRGAGGGDHKWEGDWYPRELIDVNSFEEYAEELASDCYDIPDTWPHRCIDWEKAARELAQDYSLVTFRGSDYYWR